MSSKRKLLEVQSHTAVPFCQGEDMYFNKFAAQKFNYRVVFLDAAIKEGWRHQNDASLDNLAQAIKNGYRDAEKIKEEKAFDSIRQYPRY